MNFEIAPKSTEIKATWDEARMFCFSLAIDGKIGWRLPTIFELQEIYDAPNDFRYLYYWSSTATKLDSSVTPWCMNFMNQISGQQMKFSRFLVRAIRDLS